MQIHITATTAANPSLFAFVVRRELMAARPEAQVTVRPIAAPAGRRFHTVETDAEAAFIREDLTDWLNMVRDDLEGDDPVFANG